MHNTHDETLAATRLVSRGTVIASGQCPGDSFVWGGEEAVSAVTPQQTAMLLIAVNGNLLRNKKEFIWQFITEQQQNMENIDILMSSRQVLLRMSPCLVFNNLT